MFFLTWHTLVTLVGKMKDIYTLVSDKVIAIFYHFTADKIYD